MDYFEQLWLYHLFLSYLRPVYTESYAAISTSILLILVVTFERFVSIYKSLNPVKHWMETHRPHISMICLICAAVYKISIFFEVTYRTYPQCDGKCLHQF